MSEGQLIFLVFVLIYLSDCFIWTPQNSVIFIGRIFSGFSTRFASSFLGTDINGFLPLNLFTVPGNVFCCYLIPISISPSLVVSYNPHTINITSSFKPKIHQYTIEEIQKINSEGHDVFINGKIFCSCGYIVQAENIVQLISDLKLLSLEKREALIQKFWDQQYDLSKAKLVYSEIKNKTKIISILGRVLFYLIFLITPLTAYLIGLNRTILMSGALMLLLAIVLAFNFFWYHRQLYPMLKFDRVIEIIKMVICPPVAIRSADQLSMHALSEYSPFVGSYLLLSPEKFKIFAEELYRCLKYPILDTEYQKGLLSNFEWQKHLLLDRTERYFKTINCDVKRSNSTIIPVDEKSISYCPRCLNQSYENAEECTDCVGVVMLPLTRI